MTRKALEITSRSHAQAVAVYAAQVCMGAAYVLGVPLAGTLVDYTGRLGTGIWALVLMVSGFTCFAAVLAPYSHSAISIRRALKVESYGCSLLAAGSAFYVVVSVLWGDLAAPTVTGYSAMVMIGCLARVAQIHFDLKRIQRSVQTPVETAHVVADPEEE